MPASSVASALGIGIAVTLRRQSRHEYILLESTPHRLDRTLSDLKGVAPLIHRNGARVLIARLSDNLGAPKPAVVEEVYEALVGVLPRLKAEFRSPDVFQKSIFDELRSGATEIARVRGILG